MALSADGQHVLSSYGDPAQSWALLYNLYADRLLQTNVVSDNVRCIFIKLISCTYSHVDLPALYELLQGSSRIQLE